MEASAQPRVLRSRSKPGARPNMQPTTEPSHAAGCLLLRFAADGRCQDVHELLER